MATISRKFFPLRSQYTASSKSFAFSPSMVTSGSAVRSTRSLRSAGRTSVGRRLAWRTASFENWNGNACLRSAISISMPGSVALPSTSLTRATGSRLCAGCSTISATTTCADLRVAGTARRDQEVLVDPPVFRDDEIRATLLVQAPDHFDVGARQHFDDLALGPSAAIRSALAHDRAVSMQHLVHFARVQEVVVAAVLGDEKAEAVGMPLHDADDEIELRDDAQFALAVGEQLAVALHRRETAGEGFARDRRDVELALELGRRHRNASGFQRVEDRFARRQQRRIDVAAALRARNRWRR